MSPDPPVAGVMTGMQTIVCSDFDILLSTVTLKIGSKPQKLITSYPCRNYIYTIGQNPQMNVSDRVQTKLMFTI